MSPATNRAYPLTMVCETWRVARSSVYALRAQQGGPVTPDRRQPGKRGPKTALSDEELPQEVWTVLKASPFLGEGHRKVKARLAAKGIRVGKNRVLRLMRVNGLLAPVRRGHPHGDRSHSGRIRTVCIYLHDFDTLEEAREVIGAFVERYNNGWLFQRHGYMTPARAREKLSRRAA